MPQIEAFRGLRYSLAHVGSLGDVTAPPYDVIDPKLQDLLYKKHPANVVRLILNRAELGDDEHNNPYLRAAKFLRRWRSEGVLFQEADPAIYVYHQVFNHDDQTFTRRGFMARVRLERFGEGSIYPHEETMPGPKQDRLLLTRACRANLSQVFGLYPDATGEAQRLLDSAVGDSIPLEATDHLGVINRLWPVTNLDVITAASAAMANRPLFIADGHHRFETACNYRDELAAAGPLDPRHAANFVLMMCVSMSDPGMVVLPTHRLFRGLPALDSDGLRRSLGDCFTTRVAGEGADLAPTVWQELELLGDQGTLAFFTLADERWVVARITEAGQRTLARLATNHSEAWRGLGVSILHRLVVERLLGARELPTPKYVHCVDELMSALETDEFPLAALVMPATLDHIESISSQHERMPPKSTYFYPKLLSGLVINALE